MKYMLLIYGNAELWSSFTPEQAQQAIAATEARHAALRESGEFLGAYGLGDAVQAKQVHLVDGVPVVTDGPYIEAKEHIASFTLVDCESEARRTTSVPEQRHLTARAARLAP
ncbi:MAG TPA: YciI family protein [Acidimicrobiales bacterium]|nr:YciI family protein [Acidimicrobiales bacterium]